MTTSKIRLTAVSVALVAIGVRRLPSPVTDSRHAARRVAHPHLARAGGQYLGQSAVRRKFR
ncbi:hypothetical protein [Mycobacterium leprae]|nr:hypothetical protein [Mycobacterium leprae]